MAPDLLPRPTVPPRSPGQRAVFALALAGLLANDHLLKGAGLLPAWLTGKLSDLCGLVVAPAALAWLLHVRGRAGRALCLAAVGAFFAAINLSAPAAALAQRLSAATGMPWSLWPDPTDLAALPALAIAWWLTGARPAADPGRPRAVEPALAALGALACLASGTPRHHASAYVVNRTGAPLVVGLSALGRSGYCWHAAELAAIPDGWFRDEDFGDEQLFQVAPGGVLPLSRGCPARVALGSERRMVLVNGALPSRPLPNVPDDDEFDREEGLLFLEGNAVAPLFRPGPGITLRSIALPWIPPPPNACPEVEVPRLDHGPLPMLRDAAIVARRSLGGGCFAVVVAPGEPDGTRATPDGGAADADVPDAAPPAGDAAPTDATPARADAAPDGRSAPVDGLPPLNAEQILSFCMPEDLFPFTVGDRVHVSRDSVGGLTPGSPTLSLRKLTYHHHDGVFGPPLSCGFVRESCGAIWRPREFSVRGVPLSAGVPVKSGRTTFYLARAMEVLTVGRDCGLSGPWQLEYLVVDNAP